MVKHVSLERQLQYKRDEIANYLRCYTQIKKQNEFKQRAYRAHLGRLEKELANLQALVCLDSPLPDSHESHRVRPHAIPKPGRSRAA